MLGSPGASLLQAVRTRPLPAFRHHRLTRTSAPAAIFRPNAHLAPAVYICSPLRRWSVWTHSRHGRLRFPSPEKVPPVPKNPAASVELSRRSQPDRRGDDRRKQEAVVAVERRQGERRAKVQRRRQIDPTTCEREYSAEEIEFMHALDAYKHSSGRMFPTCSEILEVIRGLGYIRATQPSDAAIDLSAPPAPETEVSDML
jgi:hypothetical protein